MNQAPINENLLEIRFQPNPRLLDFRGAFVDSLRTLMAVQEWRTTGERVDVGDKDDNLRVFVSYKNAGLLLLNPPTDNYFPDQVTKLLNYLYRQESFGNQVHLNRIGVRFRCAFPFDGSFEDLLQRFTQRIISISNDARRFFPENMIDIGAPIYFKTNIGKINTNSGPMQSSQLKEFFPNLVTDENPSLFLDMDYFDIPNKVLDVRDLISTIKTYSSELTAIKNNYLKVLFDAE